MIDLHIHSTFSDGSLTPSALVSKLFALNISVFSLTDHDTIAGVKEAEEATSKINATIDSSLCPPSSKLTFIRGVEFSIERPNCDCHLLGYGMQNYSPSFLEVLNEEHVYRRERNLKIIEKLQSLGITLPPSCLDPLATSSQIGRPHIASYLHSLGVVKSVQEAFDKYLAHGRPCYVDKKGVEIKKVIKAIKESGGVTVLAHPLSLYLSWGKLTDTLEEYKTYGVEGIEVFHPIASPHECERLEGLARKFGFFITGGSDFHGEKVREGRKLGHLYHNTLLKDSCYYDELLPALNKTHSNCYTKLNER